MPQCNFMCYCKKRKYYDNMEKTTEKAADISNTLTKFA